MADEHEYEYGENEYWWIVERAEPEGWSIFWALDRPLHILKDDDRDIFADDEAVWRHLWARYQRGDGLATRALALIKEVNPEHYAEIQAAEQRWQQEED